MIRAEHFNITTPKATTIDTADVSVEVVFDTKLGDTFSDKLERVQAYIDSECLRLCEPLVPRDTGALIASGITNTQIGSGEVRYRTAYARRWYYMPANFQDAPERSNYWFARMKERHAKIILAGAQERLKE